MLMQMFAGVAVGAGWQSIVAYVNIACYYLVGIPVGVVLGYVIHLQVKVSFFYISSRFSYPHVSFS